MKTYRVVEIFRTVQGARARAYAAKLARIREVAECDYHDTPRTVLRIIDEKESGQ